MSSQTIAVVPGLPIPGKGRAAGPQPRSAAPFSASEAELRALMLAGLDGDAASHSRLLRAVRTLLLNFFARRIGSGNSEQEDLVQEVLIAVHQRRASFDRDRPFTPWLFAIARYKLVDHFRRSHRHVPIEGLEDILEGEGFAPALEARLDVMELLTSLPAKQALAIRLTRLGEMSVADAARKAGIGESDVKVSAHRGIKSLAVRVASRLP